MLKAKMVKKNLFNLLDSKIQNEIDLYIDMTKIDLFCWDYHVSSILFFVILIIYWGFRIYFNWIQPAGTTLYSRGTYRLIVHGKFLLLSKINSPTPFFFKINLKSLWLETPSPREHNFEPSSLKETCVFWSNNSFDIKWK